MKSIGDSFHRFIGFSSRFWKRSSCVFWSQAQPIFEQYDPVVDQVALEFRNPAEEGIDLLFGREPHHFLDPGTVVPAAVEQRDFTGRGQMLDKALEIPLGLFASLGLGSATTRH